MSVAEVVRSIVADAMFKAVITLVVLDVFLGVIAALKTSEFAFTKVAAFLRDDVLGKAVPWAALYAGWQFAPDVSLVGVDLEIVTRGAGVVLIAALVGSLVSSLGDLGVPVPNPLDRGENA